MNSDDQRLVRVGFYLGGGLTTVETYDRDNPASMAAWDDNTKLGYPQQVMPVRLLPDRGAP